ncbi:MAG: trypsin-like peptidase domain-containing protein [Saprospirales bacterium]|nr:trypsin-like peptidase domain-containing protein [Saprospirales bacterium]
MNEVIDRFRSVVIQIATPYSTGTGFYLKAPNLIITNEHVIRGNQEVVIHGFNLPKQLVRVLYFDQKLDLAFLEVPDTCDIPDVPLAENGVIAQGDAVIAVGHPFGLKFSATQGIISNTMHKMGDVNYLQHDAALNPGNSGGPLVNMAGEVVGVNTFVVRDGDNIGFSLPAHYLAETIREYKDKRGELAVRCYSCGNVVAESQLAGEYCPFCGTNLEMPNKVEPYEPVGLTLTIEDMLKQLGYDVGLSRRGPDAWEIQRGSAKIQIAYHEESGLITGDAFLCLLPKDNIQPLYEFLLRQNYDLAGLTFSVRGQDVILSLLIFDRYFNVETGLKLFEGLFQKADDYDNILVETYGAIWRGEE